MTASMRVTQADGISVIELHGDYDIANVSDLSGALRALDAKDVIVDLSACTFVDSTVLTVLIRASTSETRRRLVTLLRPGHTLDRVFSRAELQRVIEIAATVDEAVALARSEP